MPGGELLANAGRGVLGGSSWRGWAYLLQSAVPGAAQNVSAAFYQREKEIPALKDKEIEGLVHIVVRYPASWIRSLQKQSGTPVIGCWEINTSIS